MKTIITMMNRIVAMGLLSIVVGCNVSVDSTPKSVEVHWMSIAGKGDVYRGELSAEDKLSIYATDLLKKEKSGWKPTFVTYVPYILVISADRLYVLNICPGYLVINFKKNRDDTRAVQLIKRVPYTIYERALEIVKKSNQANEPTSVNAGDPVDAQSEAALF